MYQVRKLKIMKPQVIFVLGGPGAGKGTQCQKIEKEFQFEHLSAGDLLREEKRRPNSQYGELIEKHIREGSIIPAEITCGLLQRAIEKSKNQKFLIDGFPRDQKNLDGWNKQMAEKVVLLLVLFFECSSAVSQQRCLHRGAAGSCRVDDNIDSLRKRFVTYANDTLPVIEHYKRQNVMHTIDASRTCDYVFEDVKAAFYSKAKGDGL